MELILFVLSIVWPIFMIYGAYKLLATHELVQGFLKDRQQKNQIKEVNAILMYMADDLRNMTFEERTKLTHILEEQYPLWASLGEREDLQTKKDDE